MAADQRIHKEMTSPSNIKKGKEKEAESGRVYFLFGKQQAQNINVEGPHWTLLTMKLHLSPSFQPTVPITLLLQAFYHSPDTCPFPSLSHVHTFFSQSSSYWLLIRSVPFPITAVPLSLHLQFLLPSFPSGLLHSVHPLSWKNTAVSVPDTSSCQDSIPAYFKKERHCYFKLTNFV